MEQSVVLQSVETQKGCVAILPDWAASVCRDALPLSSRKDSC